MKIAVVALIVFLGSVVSAKSVNFECVSSDLTYMNKFNASGVLEIDGELVESAYSNTEILWTVNLQERGLVSDIETFEDKTSYGETKIISSMTQKPFIYSVIRLEDGERAFDVRLLLDYSTRFDSQIRDTASNKTFKANCKITE